MVDLDLSSDNSGKMINLVKELADLMQERSVDLAKAYELINGGKISKGTKKEINWKSLTDEFIHDERGYRRDTTKRDLVKRMDRTLQRKEGWKQLKEMMKEKEGSNLVPYSFRHYYSLRGHITDIYSGSMASSMGHSIEAHHRAYPYSSKASTTNAFKRAAA